MEHLSSATGGPPDFQGLNSGGCSQSNVLLQRGSSKRSTAGDAPIDGTGRLAVAPQGQLDSCTNGSTVSLHPDQMKTDPVVLWVPGILEERIEILVTRNTATGF